MKRSFLKVSSIVVATVSTFFGLFSKKALAVSLIDPTAWIKDLTVLPGAGSTLEDFILKIINWAIGFSAIVAVVMIIFAGFKYITAAGDENKISSATKTLTYAIVGLVLCFIAVLLVNFVVSFLEGK